MEVCRLWVPSVSVCYCIFAGSWWVRQPKDGNAVSPASNECSVRHGLHTWLHCLSWACHDCQGINPIIPVYAVSFERFCYYCYNCFIALCPGLTSWASTRRNIHPLTYPDHYPTFIIFFHPLQSIASSLFNLHAWQSFCTTSLQVLFWLPLGLEPSTSYSIHFFTQSVSAFRSTCSQPVLV